LGVAIRATATMTLALPKTGLGIGTGPQLAGELYLADIGVPPQLYVEIGVDARTQALFAGASIVRIARR
jgi:NAD(P)H-hydrate epimerase